jgi:hypothetical protein
MSELESRLRARLFPGRRLMLVRGIDHAQLQESGKNIIGRTSTQAGNPWGARAPLQLPVAMVRQLHWPKEKGGPTGYLIAL